ncbi:MAG: DUF456 domain-containing protein [Stenotrophobium sp.]
MESALPLLFWLLAVALVVGGLVGAVLPVLPGPPLVFAGLWLAAWTDHYAHIGNFTLTVIAALGLLGIACDFAAGSFGAKRSGASPQAVAGAALGAFLGMFFGIPGLILGPFIGAVLGELRARRSLGQAAAAGIGTWVGLLLGSIAKLALSLAMIGVFAFAWLL